MTLSNIYNQNKRKVKIGALIFGGIILTKKLVSLYYHYKVLNTLNNINNKL